MSTEKAIKLKYLAVKEKLFFEKDLLFRSISVKIFLAYGSLIVLRRC